MRHLSCFVFVVVAAITVSQSAIAQMASNNLCKTCLAPEADVFSMASCTYYVSASLDFIGMLSSTTPRKLNVCMPATGIVLQDAISAVKLACQATDRAPTARILILETVGRIFPCPKQ